MPNIELLEKSMPVAPIRIAALAGCRELAEEVDKKLVKFRKELVAAKKSTIIPQGYAEKSFLVDCECPRFGTGEGKGYIKESVRGTDLYIMVDVTNYSESYTVCGHENHMSPDNHFQDLKRIISAATGKAHRINVIMPFLYEGRQHRRKKRESLDCAVALRELSDMGVSNIITFDAHDPRVCNAIPLYGFDSFNPPYQFMKALLSGEYDLNKTALIITQTGGGCRATNYIGFIRRALEKAGMAQIPVVSLNLSKLEANPGMTYTPALAIRAVQAIVYGDIFMRTVYRMRPYEKVPGSVNAMHEKWKRICNNDLKRAPSMTRFNHIIKDMIRDFDNIPIYEDKVIPRVGIVGEILVKFLPQANNHLVELLEREGAEAVMPDMLDFFLYCFYNSNFKAEKLGTSSAAARMCNIGITALEYMRKAARKAFAQSKHFTPPADIRDLAKYADPLVSIGNQTGEGWFLTGEIMELIHSGVNNVVCTQPFGCLPNHIVGKGVIKEIRHQYPESNIIAVDYDPGASEVNQLNRIKLMLATAQSNLDKDQKNKK